MVKYIADKLKYLLTVANILDTKFTQQFGFRPKETSFDNVVRYMYAAKDSSSLAVTRILFGLLMLLDIPDERGGGSMARRWGHVCQFPLLPGLTAVPMPYMALVYTALWLGAVGIAAGYKYRVSSATFTVCYWYLFIIEKSYWNNHSYLFGLVGLLLATTEANCRWSVDVYLEPSKMKKTVPYWNYFVLKYQFFILYFMAGLKKGTAEWLTGYSVQKLSEHWVFTPFRLILTVDQTDLLVVHWFIFPFDLTVALWMMWGRSRAAAMFFCALFHLMNSRLFTIGMFPWVCLATMPLFCPFDWPIRLSNKIQGFIAKTRKYNTTINYKRGKEVSNSNKECNDNIKELDKDEMKSDVLNNKKFDNNLEQSAQTIDNVKSDLKSDEEESIKDLDKKQRENVEINTISKKIVVALIGLYVFIQAFLPYSHFITKGYNTWTSGLYGYSWDMMVHTWDIESVVVKIIDNRSKQEVFIDPYVYTPNDRWTRHGDMVLQYAACLKQKLETSMDNRYSESINISIYIDVWCSMNGRFTQRMFDSKVDLLKVPWSPFEPITFIMPLIDEGLHWRETLKDTREAIQANDNVSDVIFVADFPGYTQEKFIPPELVNVTLTVMSGLIAVDEETEYSVGLSHVYKGGDQRHIAPGTFHNIINIGNKTAFYMYTFKNLTDNAQKVHIKPKLPIATELFRRLKGMVTFGKIIVKSFYHILLGA